MLISGTKYRGQFEERLRALINELEKDARTSLLIKDFFDIINTRKEDIYPLISAIKSKQFRVIITLTPKEYELCLEKDNSIFDNFNTIKIPPPNFEQTLSILKCHIPLFADQYQVEIKEDILNELISLSNLYYNTYFQPSISLSILTEMSANIEINKIKNKYADENTTILKQQSDEINKQIKEIKEQKNIVVKSQRYEEAAGLRNKENELTDELTKIKEILEESRKGIIVKISTDDIEQYISGDLSISIEKIKERKEVISVEILNKPSNYLNKISQFEFLQNQSIFHGHEVSISQGIAFVLIPHNPEFDSIYDGFIKPSVEKHGIKCLKAADIYQPGNILSQVWEQIRRAEIVIADVSNLNPNVIFELGLCYGIQRCPILLTRDPNHLPFNIRNLRYIQYTDGAAGLGKLKTDLETSIGEFLSAIRPV